MKPINEKLQQEILEISKKEFLEYGYNKTTVRKIAKAIGCTTGAIYRYYKGKEAIFDALVKEPADDLLERFRKVALDISSTTEKECLENVPETSSQEFDWMMEYIYDHYDVFRLICCASEGTKYENYIEKLIEIEEESSNRYIKMLEKNNMLNKRLDPFMNHIFANTLFSGLFETVRHNLPKEVAIEHMKTLQLFYLGGWVSLLGME